MVVNVFSKIKKHTLELDSELKMSINLNFAEESKFLTIKLCYEHLG